MRSGWEDLVIGDILKLSSGSTKPSDLSDEAQDTHPYPVYGGNGVMGYSAQQNADGENLIIGRVGEKCGCVHYYNGKCWITDNALYARNIRTNVDIPFFYHCLISQNLSQLRNKGGQPLVSQQPIYGKKILLPPLPEQRKIAAILRTWDEAIEKLEKLKQQRKKLFHQRRRQLTDITSGHGVKFQLLSEISKEINRRNDDYDAPVMMISSTQGFIRQDANYDREMAGESLKKYIYLKEGEFAYNKGNSKTYPYGCIFRLEVPHALIPFVYICFKLDDKLNAGYFRHYFEAGSINRQLVRLISSSVRGNCLLNIDADDFFSCHIPVPDRSYQDTCANFLDAATKELTALDAEISFIKNQKRGLMQKLLTGAWRVQVDESNNTHAEKISCSMK